MNKIFSQEGNGWSEFPITSYGRLDQTEPLNPSGAPEAVFAFDVVDVNWPQFAPSATFDLSNVKRIERRQRRFWQSMSRPRIGRRRPDPFATAPIYRIEVTSRPGDRFFDHLISLAEEDWVKITLAPAGTFEVDIFGGLFAAPVPAHLIDITVERAMSTALSAVFDMKTWPDASVNSIHSVLSNLQQLEFLLALDVGQGSANALADASEDTQLFFDLGCGVYRNAGTRPIPLRFCWRANPPIVLSHWDSDHWAGETSDPAASRRTWIVPRQTITPKHTTFASRILSGGGAILVWGSTPSTISVPIGIRQNLDLARCTGPSRNRNGSGISCVVCDTASSRGWLLTGDAGYHELGQPSLPTDLRVIIAPHHGADMGGLSVPPHRPTGYTRLIYSFGPGNKHGQTNIQHPTPHGVQAHVNHGWNHNSWSVAAPANCVAGGDVLATASHPGTHLDGAVAAWTAPPSVPFRTVPCAASAAPGQGCTGHIRQA